MSYKIYLLIRTLLSISSCDSHVPRNNHSPVIQVLNTWISRPLHTILFCFDYVCTFWTLLFFHIIYVVWRSDIVEFHIEPIRRNIVMGFMLIFREKGEPGEYCVHKTGYKIPRFSKRAARGYDGDRASVRRLVMRYLLERITIHSAYNYIYCSMYIVKRSLVEGVSAWNRRHWKCPLSPTTSRVRQSFLGI